MPEKLTPEIRGKIIDLRKQGKSFIQIEDELKVKRGAFSHIGNRSWFVTAMKEKREDGKTGYRLFSEARKARLKSRKEVKGRAKKEKGKEKDKQRKAIDEPSDKKAVSKEVIDAEVKTHLEGSDKDLRRGKEKKEPQAGGGDGNKVKKEKGKKGKGALLIVLILIIAAAVIIALFMVFGRKEKGKEPGEELGKEGEGKKEFDGRPFDNL